MPKQTALVTRVYRAKENMCKADDLIRDYMPFIEAETAKFLHRAPDLHNDDELSIAMIAFHEAIQSYSKERGAFLSFASVLIHNRLIDYYRREKKHREVLSIEVSENDHTTLADTLVEPKDDFQNIELRDATKNEIETLEKKLQTFSLTISDVAKHCPKQDRTMQECKKMIRYAVANPEILKTISETGRLPVQEFVKTCKVSKKVVERHRKYLLALLLIYTNGYVILRGHIQQILTEGGNKS